MSGAVQERRAAGGDGLAARLLGPRPLTATLALSALVALVGWEASPYGRYLHHEYEPASAGGQAVAIALFLAGWLLMCAATMLPATIPLAGAFDARLAQRRPRTGAGPAARARARLLLAAGVLAVWLLVGYLFRSLDVLIHAAVDGVGWLGARPGLVAAATLAVAGAYQFAPAKRRCLRACRDATPAPTPLRTGIVHGRACVGSCWALMLVMFGLGMSHPALMLGIAALTSAERFAPRRLRLSHAAGAALLGAAAIVAVAAIA